MEKELNKVLAHPVFKKYAHKLQKTASFLPLSDIASELAYAIYFIFATDEFDELSDALKADYKNTIIFIYEKAVRKAKDTIYLENGYVRRNASDLADSKVLVEQTYYKDDELIIEEKEVQTNSARYKRNNIVSLNEKIDDNRTYEDLLLNEEAISVDAQYQLELEETALENIAYLQSVLKSKSLAIFNLFLNGLDAEEIADRLEIKEASVKRTFKRILEKLEEKNKEEAEAVVEAEEVVEDKLVIVYEVKKEATHSEINLTSNLMKNARAFKKAYSTNQLPTPSKVKELLRNKNNIEKRAEKGFEYIYYKCINKTKLLKRSYLK